MMKKRCCSLLLCACLTAGMVPVSFAAEVQPDYTAVQEKASGATSGTCGENLTWTLDDEGTLTISGTGEMYDYRSSDSTFYYKREQIQNIVLNEGVTHIGNYAFLSCNKVKTVSIPDSVKSIGRYCFERSGLEEIIVPSTVEHLGEGAFHYCENLTKAELCGAIPQIDAKTFFLCKKLEQVILSNEIQEISADMFDSCIALKKITLPDKLTKIDGCAFQDSGLTEIDIPDGVTYIGNYAFTNTNIKSLVIPDSVVYEGLGMVQNCEQLEYIELSPNAKVLKEDTFSGCKALIELDIPEGVEEIEAYAFGTNGLKYIGIPYSMKKIGNYAFHFCKNLTEVYYGGSEKTLNEIEIGQFNAPLYDADIYLAMPFDDVPMDSYYAQPVIWAYQNDITSGVDDTHFAPNRKCTRAQVVTFLWNAAGQPKVDADISFTDVKPGSWYEQAVKWAVSEGVTAGTSTTTFSPNATCTRAQVVTFLWNAEGQPQVDATVSFRDVPAGAWYEQAVKWAVSEGVTAGTSATTFSPNATCIRAQVVTFLHNYLAI